MHLSIILGAKYSKYKVVCKYYFNISKLSSKRAKLCAGRGIIIIIQQEQAGAKLYQT